MDDTVLAENIIVLLRACVLLAQDRVQDVGLGESGHLPNWLNTQPHTPAAVEEGSPGDSPVRLTVARQQTPLEHSWAVCKLSCPEPAPALDRALSKETHSFVPSKLQQVAPRALWGPALYHAGV